jgi:hypothetical protein
MSMTRKDGQPRVGTEGDKLAKREAAATPEQHARRLRSVADAKGVPVEKITNGHGNVG